MGLRVIMIENNTVPIEDSGPHRDQRGSHVIQLKTVESCNNGLVRYEETPSELFGAQTITHST